MYFIYVIMRLQNLHTVAVFKGVGMKMACVRALLYGMMKQLESTMVKMSRNLQM